MTSVIEYISANYINLLIIVVLVFLAVIGYFAEKASNKQKNKNKEENKIEDNDNSISERSIDGLIFDSKTGKLVKREEKSVDNAQMQINDLTPNSEVNGLAVNKDDIEQTSQINNVDDLEQNNNQVIDLQISNDESNTLSNDFGQINEQDNNTETNNLKLDDFNQFDLEFDSLLPKKEIIETDLLSDIDSLELDKTQKIDLSDIPDLDNIDLPKIKQLKEEDDVWKF